MKIDGGLMGNLAKSGDSAKRLESIGFHGAITAETSHDPFSVAPGGPRNREYRTGDLDRRRLCENTDSLANIGHDLNSFFKGRFILGLDHRFVPHNQAFVCLGLDLRRGCGIHPCYASHLGLLAQWYAANVSG